MTHTPAPRELFGSRPLRPHMESPKRGDRILVVRLPYLDMLLSGEKSLEVRCHPYKPGKYYLGRKKTIYGSVVLGAALPIRSVEQWNQLRGQHCVPDTTLPYKSTFGLPVLKYTVAARRIGYQHPRGAIGIVKYR